VSLRLYDTASRSVRELQPVHAGHVGIYHCGLTVQGAPHVGHIRKEVTFDLLRRWLEHNGSAVTLIANVTDIDDKILAKSAEQDRPWWAHAYTFELALHEAYAALGCLPPTYEPRATGHIPEMVEMIGELIDRGHAYAADGDVYFDVRSWPSYGELSGQRLEEMEPAADADPRGKRDPRDFALWKGAKPTSPTPRAGRRLGVAAAPAGTWSARRWPASTSAPSSTSTAAGSTSASPTTRTSSPSRAPAAARSPACGCTTRWSPQPARR
jgi:cysteinyl-tRNA synthetase